MNFGMQDSASSIEIKLKRNDRTYRPGEKVEGVIHVKAYKGWTHSGLIIVAEGTVHLSTTSRGIMALGSDYSTKQLQVMKFENEVAPTGRFADGTTEVPFEFALKPLPGQTLYESYHGVYISVIYSILVTCDRGMMKKSLRKDTEFIVEVPSPTSTISDDPVPASFNISPDTIENLDKETLAALPKFKVSGKLHRSKYPITVPFTGEVVVEESSVPIRSIEVQLVRVESVLYDNQISRESTEVQNIQIGEGNTCRGMIVPMYMVFPRLFSCATIITPQFKIEFEANLIMVFTDGYMITENFPIALTRPK